MMSSNIKREFVIFTVLTELAMSTLLPASVAVLNTRPVVAQEVWLKTKLSVR